MVPSQPSQAKERAMCTPPILNPCYCNSDQVQPGVVSSNSNQDFSLHFCFWEVLGFVSVDMAGGDVMQTSFGCFLDVSKSSGKALAGMGKSTWSVPITAQPVGTGWSTTLENTLGEHFHKRQGGPCRCILVPGVKRGENKIG